MARTITRFSSLTFFLCGAISCSLFIMTVQPNFENYPVYVGQRLFIVLLIDFKCSGLTVSEVDNSNRSRWLSCDLTDE